VLFKRGITIENGAASLIADWNRRAASHGGAGMAL
jgi:hypothetical protein